MFKKGDGGEAIKYIIITAVIIAIIFIGFKAVTTIQDKLCEGSLTKLYLELKGLDKTVKVGASKEMTLDVPCGIDKIYFFDPNDPIDTSVLEGLPLLRDSVESRAEKNIFFVKKGKVVGSIGAGNLDLEYPNYLCLQPTGEKIGFFVEGKSNAVSIIPACTQPECTYIPVDPKDVDAATILREANKFGKTQMCDNCPRETLTAFANYIQTKENMIISRKYEYCKASGITNVEITLIPKDKAELSNLVIYEFIPKECISDLHQFLATQLDDEFVDIKADPLIMWRIDNLDSEQKISYALKTFLSDKCKQSIKAIGASRTIENGKRVVVPEMPGEEGPGPGENTPPTFTLPTQYEITGVEGTTHLIVARLSRYASDKEVGRAGLGFSITGQTNTNAMTCSIVKKEQLVCKIKDNDFSFSDIKVEVFDGEFSVESRIRVRVKQHVIPSSCGDRVCNNVEENCAICRVDCGSCASVYPQMYLKCGYNPKTFCSFDIECPEGHEQYGHIGNCGLMTIKKSYTCLRWEITDECSTTQECPGDGVEILEIPCVS